jgi:pimeloyl-ACP methyl ester carboxylesterase
VYAKSGAIHYRLPGAWVTVRSTSSSSRACSRTVEHQWEEPGFARFLNTLASFSRLIIIDARGAGLSDRALELPPMEEQMDDVLAVLDAVGSQSAAFFGNSQAGPMGILFAATHPERSRALVLYGSYAGRRRRRLPVGRSKEWLAGYDRLIDDKWGSGVFLEQVAPSRVNDEAFRRWWSKYERLSYRPGQRARLFPHELGHGRAGDPALDPRPDAHPPAP